MFDLTSNLKDVMKKDSLFQFKGTHESEFQSLEEAITKEIILQYFNPTKPVILWTDVSQVGWGSLAPKLQGNCICF